MLRNMSGESSDWPLERGKMVKSLLGAISAIVKSLACVQVEKETMNEIASFFYRVSHLVRELRVDSNSPATTVEVLKFLHRRLDSAVGISLRLERNEQQLKSSEVKIAIQQLEGVIKSTGKYLSLVPISTFGDQYAGKEAEALCKDLQDVKLGVSERRSSRILMKREGKTDLLNSLDSVNVDLPAMIDNNNEALGLPDKGLRNGMPQLAQYMEPTYDAFFCPLSKRIMDDPVTIESGVTYNRGDITEWFEKNMDVELTCPQSGKKLQSKLLMPNIALKATIDQWKARNEMARIKMDRAALSLASTDNMVLAALQDLQNLCKSRKDIKEKVHGIGIIHLLGKFLEHRSISIKFATLLFLRTLAEDDEERKDIIANTIDISTILKMSQSNNKDVKHACLLLLLELSRCQVFCNKITTIPGGILMLIRVKSNRCLDAFASEAAYGILKNLERHPENIRIMAENGFWEPLLTHLVEDDEEIKMKMATCIGDIVHDTGSKIKVAERASPALIHMWHTGNFVSKYSAFRALKQISIHHPSAKILAEAGVLQITVEEMFTRKTNHQSMTTEIEAAELLANILESGLQVDNFQASSHGHKMASAYVIYGIIHRIKDSNPDELNMNLIRILLCMISSPNASCIIVSVVKETEAIHHLIGLINSLNEELGMASMKLLIKLSSFIGNALSDSLCKSKGMPENLIQEPQDITQITEKEALSANFLAKLPHHNLKLNLALVNSNTILTVIKIIGKIQAAGARWSQQASSYYEGLVGILVRMTATLYDYDILRTARTYNFAAILTDMITRSSSDEVHILAAMGLENLSKQSIKLSRPPPRKKTKFLKLECYGKSIRIKMSRDKTFSLCPIHRGICSASGTFCLLQSDGMNRLVACLDHENVEVIQSALSALSTLLDDKVNAQNSVKLLSAKGAIHHVLNAVNKHEEEVVRQKAFWVIERFLMYGRNESVTEILENRLFPSTVSRAYIHGDDSTRKMAETILMYCTKFCGN